MSLKIAKSIDLDFAIFRDSEIREFQFFFVSLKIAISRFSETLKFANFRDSEKLGIRDPGISQVNFFGLGSILSTNMPICALTSLEIHQVGAPKKPKIMDFARLSFRVGFFPSDPLWA